MNAGSASKPLLSRINFEALSLVIVDDNQQSLDILVSVITGFGAKKIHRCLSALEAQRVISIGDVDMVMTDARMPEMDGYDLTR